MDLEPWNPWREFERVRAEADAIFERFFQKVQKSDPGRPVAFFPTTDLIETSDDLRVFMSLPGVVEEDIDIAVEGGVLIIRGERESPYDQGRARSRVTEWRYGFFERRLELPPEADAERLSAKYLGGVLTVVIPKKARAGGAGAGG